MTPKIKNDLSYLYELKEFESFKKYCGILRENVKKQLLRLDMSQSGAIAKAAGLQGQAFALEVIFEQLKLIHKKQMEKEFPKKPKS